MLLSATPLINYKYDIINLVSLINNEKPIDINSFDKIASDPKKLEEYVKNIFSFYIKNSNNKDKNFPSKKIIDIFLPMSEKYYKIYTEVENGEVKQIPDFKNKNIHVFYNGLRRASNIIDTISPKIDWIIDKFNAEPNAKFVIYSHFINMGIKPIMNWLNKNNIKYGNVTGDLSIDKREDYVKEYNNNEIKILFISKAGSEGLDLKNTNFIIILEPTWNENTIEQIIGRGVRYKSHESLPKSKKNVTVYRLYCIKPDEYKNLNRITKNYLLTNKDEMLSVDLYLRNFSWLKQQELIKFYKLLAKMKIEN